MLFKALLLFCLVHVVQSSCQQEKLDKNWQKIGKDLCVGGQNSQYKEFTYNGPSSYITAMKLVHKKGQIGCGLGSSKWGCGDNYHPINIIVTDIANKRIYPSPSLVKLKPGGWYYMSGYGTNSPELVFLDPGFRYLPKGQKMRIWYGEDLYHFLEYDNHGYTCMDVYVKNSHRSQ